MLSYASIQGSKRDQKPNHIPKISLETIKELYNGYSVVENKVIYQLYNPYAVNLSLRHEEARPYWVESGKSQCVLRLSLLTVYQ